MKNDNRATNIKILKIFGLIVLISFILVFVIAVNSNSNSNSTKQDQKTTPEKETKKELKEYSQVYLKTSARTLCKILVKDQLLPFKAEFPFADYKIFTTNTNRYVVKSNVTTQNQFGAELQLNYHCDVEYTGNGQPDIGSSWILHTFEIIQ